MGRLRGLGALLLEAFHLRAELFSVEAREERERTFRMLVLLLVGIAASFLCVVFASAAVIWQFPQHRVLVASLLAVGYAVAALTLFLRLRSLAAETPFSESIEQLREDARSLAGRTE